MHVSCSSCLSERGEAGRRGERQSDCACVRYERGMRKRGEEKEESWRARERCVRGGHGAASPGSDELAAAAAAPAPRREGCPRCRLRSLDCCPATWKPVPGIVQTKCRVAISDDLACIRKKVLILIALTSWDLRSTYILNCGLLFMVQVTISRRNARRRQE